MMRVAYLTPMNVRGMRSHVHNVLKTCEALQAVGTSVSLISLDQAPENLEEIWQRHDVRDRFTMEFLNHVPFEEQMGGSVLHRLWILVRMNRIFASLVWKRRNEFDVIYYRYHLFILPLIAWKWLLRKKVIFECHHIYLRGGMHQICTRFNVSRSSGVVMIAEGLRNHYRLPNPRVIVSPCHAVEMELVPHRSIESLREECHLPQNKKILIYTGSIGVSVQGASYNVRTLIDVLPSLSADYVALIVGAKDDPKPIADLERRAQELGVRDRVMIRPWCDRPMVMKYSVASDILIIPKAPGSSPSKMFDYLACGKPIVAARQPGIEEILHDKENALLVNADHPEEWGNAIRLLEQDADLSQRIIHGAIQSAKLYTWNQRGEKIKNFIIRL